VHGLQEEFTGQLRIVSADVQSSLGRELSREYGAFTPTFVFFDGQGNELWRMIGTIDPEKVRQSLK
jgi:thioredoxin-related protein